MPKLFRPTSFRWPMIAALGLAIIGCDRTVQTPGSGTDQPSSEANQASVDSSSLSVSSLSSIPPSPDTLPGLSSKDSSTNVPSLEAPAEVAAVPSIDSDNKPQLPEESTGSAVAASNQLVVEIKRSNNPAEMVEYLRDIDRAIERLLGSERQSDPDKFRESAIQLAKTKLEASKHLIQLENASPEQLKIATVSQLIALSHLSGLKDVQSAKQLEELANKLREHADPDLRQQGKVVTFGFLIQSLQNGLISESQSIVDAGKELLADERFRNRLEMSSLQHAMNVLEQMGYHEQVTQLQQIAFEAYEASADMALRHESWNRLAFNSPEQQAFVNSLDRLGSDQFEAGAALDAANNLLRRFASPVTLEMLAQTLPEIEYAGHAEFSKQLGTFLLTKADSLPLGASTHVFQAIMTEHQTRQQWLDRSLDLSDLPELQDLQGTKLNLQSYLGKVVLVTFWSAQSLPCLRELPLIQQAYTELNQEGFEILSINMDLDNQHLRQVQAQHRLPWTSYVAIQGEVGPITQKFGITMFPHNMLIDRQGKVVSMLMRGESIGQQARHWLSMPNP